MQIATGTESDTLYRMELDTLHSASKTEVDTLFIHNAARIEFDTLYKLQQELS